MTCPDCGYMMSAFEKECSRCQRIGKPSPAPAPVAEPPTPPPVAFVPSPYPAQPPGMPSPPIPPALIRFIGWLMIVLAVAIVVGVFVAVNQHAEHERQIDNICDRVNASSGLPQSDCRAQLAAQGY